MQRRWLPGRRGSFAASPEWRPFNIEVALDRISPWSFSKRDIQPVLFFDYQTHLENNTHGRHGSGRAGVFRGYYVKASDEPMLREIGTICVTAITAAVTFQWRRPCASG